ncbi:glycosyltransferase family 4 protein [Halomonas halodenitrificans]|uniref:glycosyltransferase family 4 protein n=1 Tax=Halomonas halodenitrificans TaxID=28252 RepID=UPI000A01FB98|nr:glycosyltransferase family 4 protein [Halomonas halodenitrificans]
MRVLMVSVRADHGGGPRHIELLIKNLDKLIEAHVACPQEPPYAERFNQLARGNVFSIPHRKFDLSCAVRLSRYVLRKGVDIVHTHGKGAGVYGRFVSLLTGKPCLHTPHGVHVGNYNALSERLYRFYENLTIRLVDRLVFVSNEEYKVAQKNRLWPRTPYKVIENGVEDVSHEERISERSAFRQCLGISSEAVVVTTLSRFDFQKNMQEAFQVAQELPEVVFLWVGHGNDFAELKKKAAEEKVENLIFLGAMDSSTPALAAADVYFSSARWEGLPLAVLEAMAMGLPVVASDVTGHFEIVGESGGGVLYPLGRPGQAVKKLKLLVADEGLRRQLGDRGRKVQQKCYSSKVMAQEVCNIYRELGGE